VETSSAPNQQYLFPDTKQLVQYGLAGDWKIARTLTVYGEAMFAADVSHWKAGLRYAARKDWDIDFGYRFTNTRALPFGGSHYEIKTDGWGLGLAVHI